MSEMKVDAAAINFENIATVRQNPHRMNMTWDLAKEIDEIKRRLDALETARCE